MEDASYKSYNDYLIKNWENVFSSMLKLVATEISVYGDLMRQHTPPATGRIDFLVKPLWRQKKYLVEATLNDSSDKWGGFKILAYRAAFSMDNVIKPSEYGAMIFLTQSCFNYRLRNILSVLGIEWCVFTLKDDFILELREASLWET